jgi:hypothetical protein
MLRFARSTIPTRFRQSITFGSKTGYPGFVWPTTCQFMNRSDPTTPHSEHRQGRTPWRQINTMKEVSHATR